MASINTTCPRCNAPHAKKLSLIYSEGICTVQSSTQSVGHTNTIGKVKITTAGTTTGVQQSEASKGAAPPFVPELVSIGAKSSKMLTTTYGCILAVVVPMIAIVSDASFLVVIGIAAVILLLTFILVSCIDDKPSTEETKAYEDATKTERAAYDKWNQTFACGSCEHRFIPEQTI